MIHTATLQEDEDVVEVRDEEFNGHLTLTTFKEGNVGETVSLSITHAQALLAALNDSIARLHVNGYQ